MSISTPISLTQGFLFVNVIFHEWKIRCRLNNYFLPNCYIVKAFWYYSHKHSNQFCSTYRNNSANINFVSLNYISCSFLQVKSLTNAPYLDVHERFPNSQIWIITFVTMTSQPLLRRTRVHCACEHTPVRLCFVVIYLRFEYYFLQYSGFFLNWVGSTICVRFLARS